MSSRYQDILALLASGSRTASEIATIIGCPAASVRRTLQELRTQGHNIAFASPTGLYRMGAKLDTSSVNASA